MFERKACILAVLSGVLLACASAPAVADKIKNPIAVFSGLDKITGRIFQFEVQMGETVEFGVLQVTPRVCYSRPPTEAPRTDGFVEVGELDDQKAYHAIFTGWMFADSPGLHGVEDPIYDVWLVDCKGGTDVIKETPPTPVAEAPPPDLSADTMDPTTAMQDPNGLANAAKPAPKKHKKKPAPTVINAGPLDLGAPN